MRLFPRAARRRLGAVVAVCSLALGGLAVPLAHADWSRADLARVDVTRSDLTRADDLTNKQKRVRNRIEDAGDHLEMSSSRLVRAAERLEIARVELSGARAGLVTASTELADARLLDIAIQDELGQAHTDLEFARLAVIAGTAELGRQRDTVAGVISSIYTQGDPELLAFAGLVDAQTPEDLIRQTQARDIIVGRETRAYDDLAAAEVLLEIEEDQVAEAGREVESRAREAAAHVAILETLETEAQAATDDVVRLVADRKDASVEAKSAKAADRKTLAKLEKEDQRIEELLVERARRARLRALREARLREQREARLRELRQARPPRSGASGTSDETLQRPVPGAVTSPYGMRTHPIFGYYGLHDGTDFRGDCGSPLYAAADGQVVAAYSSNTYGNRLLLDHGFQRGVGLATIYNHASSYTVGVGAQVARGQVIGYVGTTGWSTACHLHFSVMANGKPVDPEDWF